MPAALPLDPVLPGLPLPAGPGVAEWPHLPGACTALGIAEAAQRHPGPVLALCANEQQAWRLEEELRFFAGDRLPVLHLPDTEVLPYDHFSPHQEILSARLAALDALPRLTRGIVVTTVDALIQPLPPRNWLEGRRFHVKVGDSLPPHPFRERLVAAGYQSVSEIQMQGEFAIRGSLIDLFPMGSETAYRIDLFGDDVESIRTLDVETQRSTGTVAEIRLMPAREFPSDKAAIESFRKRYREYFAGDPVRSKIYSEVSRGVMPGGIEAWLPLFFEACGALPDFLPPNLLVAEVSRADAALAADWTQIEERYERLSGDLERPLIRPRDLFHPVSGAVDWLDRQPRLRLAVDGDGPCRPLRGGAEAIRALLAEPGSRAVFVAESAGRREALLGWLRPLGVTPASLERWTDLSPDTRFAVVIGPLQDALRLPDGRALIAESQLFGLTAPAQRERWRSRVRDPETLLKDLSELREGTPVVHVQHGIGLYRGLVRMDAGGTAAEFLVLEYQGGDKVYVPIGSLHLVHRYIGADAAHAPVHALGSDRWAKAQERAKKRVRDVAAELLQVQARRAARPGIASPVNDAEYAKFCAGFPFQPTADQQKAIDDVLADMARDRPMDRVVCGDVGFGKTEVALRASFAAVHNGRQVVVLVPTTLLAQQHYKNFADRYAGTPVRIGALSRMRTPAEMKALLADAADGKADIVIGTHRLLQADVKFANLGLIIVDEEHRFGVRHKERLKALRAEVDMLTLTATPIPRTLNMSLAGLRDLSIIATPPEGRLPIRTFVAESERGLIYEACLRELRRGGQIYFLHNEVQDIEKRAEEIRQLVPEATVRVAHGQMRERELEQVMLDFYHRRFNLLVCTTIIESGIDVPTANTLIVDRADEIGLAALHQLRGRVGRSHHRAYAYFLVPSRRALKPDAAQRLEAIEAMGELGSGFMLATHDLEIRGAGELLGEEQSGQIEEVGFTYYSDLLAQTVRALRRGDIADAEFGAAACEVDLGVSALLPDDYIPDVHTRLTLYKRLSETPDAAELEELAVEMIDRFGPLPEPAQRLVEATRLRLQAQALGIVRLRVSARGAILDLSRQPAIEPRALIALIQQHPKNWKLEGQSKIHWIAPAPLGDSAARATSVGAALATLAAK